MIDKYEPILRKMHAEIVSGKGLSEVVKDHFHIFNEDGIGLLGIIHYFNKYMKKI